MTDTPANHNSPQPKILVTGSLQSPYATQTLVTALRELAQSALDGLARADGIADFIEASNPGRSAEAALEAADGLLVLGGADANPALYGQTQEADTIYGVDAEADAFETALIQGATARGLPILGICRGLQLLNIAARGTLVQEIGAGGMHYSSAENSVMTGHPIAILPDTRLAGIYGATQLQVRSGHHQAVAELGEGLRVAARASDGIIEAIEGEGEHWLVGVQWHPEDAAAPQADLDKLLSAFVAASAGR